MRPSTPDPLGHDDDFLTLDEELPEVTIEPPPVHPVLVTPLEEPDESADDERVPEATDETSYPRDA